MALTWQQFSLTNVSFIIPKYIFVLTTRNLSGRKHQIESEATRLFEARGFAATSMRELATELGMEAASLYFHIKSKDELLKSICFTMADAFFEAIGGVAEETLPTVEKLRAAIDAHVKVITKKPSAAAVFFSEWRHLKEPDLSRFLDMRQNYEQKILTIIKEGIADKELDVDDPKFAVRMLLNSMNWIHTWYRPDGAMKPEEISRKIFEMVINGIGMRKNLPE